MKRIHRYLHVDENWDAKDGALEVRAEQTDVRIRLWLTQAQARTLRDHLTEMLDSLPEELSTPYSPTMSDRIEVGTQIGVGLAEAELRHASELVRRETGTAPDHIQVGDKAAAALGLPSAGYYLWTPEGYVREGDDFIDARKKKQGKQ